MKKKLLPIATLLLGFSLLLSILLAANYSITPRLSGGESFRVPWMGARTFLFEQNNPYVLEAARDVQIEIYGHPAEEGEYPYRLDIPFYLLVFYFPFAFIESFDLARALWMSFSEIALFSVGFLSVYLTGWKISRLNLTFFFIALFFSFYGFYPLIEASGAIFTALFLLLSLLAFREELDAALGVLLIFSVSTLQNGGVLFLFILYLIISDKRWRAFSISAMTLSVCVVISLFFLPDWLLPFAGSLRANAQINQGILLSETLQIWRPDDGLLIANIIKWVSLLILFLEWRTAQSSNFQRILWVASLSIVITPFLGISITAAFFTVLFFPLLLILKTAETRWKYAKWGVPFFFLSLLSSWVVFLQADHSIEILTFGFPFILLIGLYWMRWWLIRPPRTWADQVMKK